MKKLHDSLYITGQINPNDIETLAKQGIQTIINNRPDQEETGQPTQQQVSEQAAMHGINYVYLPMANGQPMPADLVANFKNALDKSEGPVLAHCRSGMRSTFIWALGQVGQGAMTVDEVIEAAQNANIPLANYRAVLENAVQT